MGTFDLFSTDADGRTPLFREAAAGNLQAVEAMIYSLVGTGVCCQRLALISKKDKAGLTAADVAEQAGHGEIASVLRGEQMRMEFYE